jgi:TonB family protein
MNEEPVTRRIAAVYPRTALMRGEQAIVRLHVIVSETGRVEECVINGATIADNLESPACKEMEQAEFAPALDANGDPFRSFYATSIIYRINN